MKRSSRISDPSPDWYYHHTQGVLNEALVAALLKKGRGPITIVNAYASQPPLPVPTVAMQARPRMPPLPLPMAPVRPPPPVPVVGTQGGLPGQAPGQTRQTIPGQEQLGAIGQWLQQVAADAHGRSMSMPALIGTEKMTITTPMKWQAESKVGGQRIYRLGATVTKEMGSQTDLADGSELASPVLQVADDDVVTDQDQLTTEEAPVSSVGPTNVGLADVSSNDDQQAAVQLSPGSTGVCSGFDSVGDERQLMQELYHQ